MFIDSALVAVKAGRGGDGAVSLRHEKYVDKGGPDGGDGGRGGNVIFVADERKDTLIDFRFKPDIAAEDGQRGGKRNRHGKNGDDTVVYVPVGTQVFRGDTLLVDLDAKGARAIVAKGGDGGFGNAHFKSSTRQTPRVAELGENGDEFEARLELKLLADVGLIGFPNAGKSTFLSVISNAKPEIADYEFTTIRPNLGVADIDDTSLLVADIPGLIEGASEGKGLGDAFLRHVERTAVLIHMIDSYSNDVAADYQVIRRELAQYSQALTERPEIVVLTKIDGLDDDIITMQKAALQKVLALGTPLFAISSQAHTGLKEVLRAAVTYVMSERTKRLEEHVEAEEAIPTISLSSHEQDAAWHVRKEDDRYIVTGTKIEKFAARTNFGDYHGENRLRDIMRKLGIVYELSRLGARGNDEIWFGESDQYHMTLDEQ